MDVAGIARVAFTSEDHVRDVIHNFNSDGFDSLYPRYRGIEAQFTALRYFALDGSDHLTHRKQGSMIRRYINWRNRHVEDQQLRRIVSRANAA